MSKKTKKIVLLTEDELRHTILRLSSEIVEKVKNLNNLLLVGIPTRGIELTEVIEKELFSMTGLKVRKGTIDPTFYRDDQNRVGTRLIQAADIPTPIEKQEILLIDDVIYTGRTIRAAIDALYSWGRPQRVMLLVMIDRGHRELPIQPDFCGKKVPTSKIENISLRLKNVDEEEITKWDKKPIKLVLKNKSNIGEDNLKLFFKITKNADLLVKCFDVKDEFFGEYNLGNIF